MTNPNRLPTWSARTTALCILAISALVCSSLRGQSHPTSKPSGDFVVPLALDGLIQKPANLFNLQGKTLRFTPAADGQYQVQVLSTATAVACPKALEPGDAQGGNYWAQGWPVALPFAFSFAGKSWDHLFVNRNGNLSFDKSESDYWAHHDPWSDGGMRSVAAAIDACSAAGLEQMIAVLWGTYDPNPKLSQVRIKVDAESVAVTWIVTRIPWGESPAGTNTFQVRINHRGVIEMVYPRVAERDGIVGLFTSQPVDGKQLHIWRHKGKAHASVDVDTAEIYDAGSVLRCVITMNEDALTSVGPGTLDYRCFFERNGFTDQLAVSVTDSVHASTTLGPSPTAAGFKIHGRVIEGFVSKVLFAGCREFTPSWDIIWWGMPGRNTPSPGKLPAVNLSGVSAPEVHFSAADGLFGGNIFEVFHYGEVDKKSERLLRTIYKTVPAEDDIALVFTDFRMDDLYGSGGGAMAANFAIKGIGSGAEKPRSTESIGSKQLQMSIATVWMGAESFAESGVDGGRHWTNYAKIMKWITHECTHRWGMHMSFRKPGTHEDIPLADGTGHWLEGLNTTVAFPAGSRFLDRPAVGYSIMGGAAWKEKADGTFSKSDFPGGVAGGYSALDLYVMGLLPPERVPPTFLLNNLKDMGKNRFSADKVTVRIEDIISAMGPREPTSAEAQKVFRMRLYLVHEPDRDVNPVMLNRAKRLSNAVADFFGRATGGAMRVIPSGS